MLYQITLKSVVTNVYQIEASSEDDALARINEQYIVDDTQELLESDISVVDE